MPSKPKTDDITYYFGFETREQAVALAKLQGCTEIRDDARPHIVPLSLWLVVHARTRIGYLRNTRQVCESVVIRQTLQYQTSSKQLVNLSTDPAAEHSPNWRKVKALFNRNYPDYLGKMRGDAHEDK